jgi:hypothetical protein
MYSRERMVSGGVVERRVAMGLQFGIFDHIEPVPGQALTQIYQERLHLLERYDAAGFYAYHLAEHHTPAVHSLAPRRMSSSPPRRSAPDSYGWRPVSMSSHCTTRCG